MGLSSLSVFSPSLVPSPGSPSFLAPCSSQCPAARRRICYDIPAPLRSGPSWPDCMQAMVRIDKSRCCPGDAAACQVSLGGFTIYLSVIKAWWSFLHRSVRR